MPAPRGLLQRLDQSLHRSGLLPRKGTLLVAVSGGADSVALLRLLSAIGRSGYWKWKLIVAHVDHGIRGQASRADAAFVRALARRLKLPCRTSRLSLGPRASEDVARRARLKALRTLARQTRAAAVIMAHHADDQAETVLMRILRGCGIDGLSGMLPRAAIDGLLVCRPLLEVRRADLQAFLRDGKHTWREDHTNASPQYLRNRVRHELMPVLLQIAPRAVEALGRLARLAAETQQLVHDAAAGIAPTTPRARRSVTLPRRALRHAPPAVAAEVLRQAIAGLGGSSESADFERVQAFLQVLRSGAGGKELQMGLGITARIQGEHVRVQRRRKS